MSDPVTRPQQSQRCNYLQIEHLQNEPVGQGTCHLKGEHSVFISLRPRPIHYVQTQDGKTHTALYRKGDMLITPADLPLAVRWQEDETCLHIRLTDEFLKAVAQETLAQDCDRLILQPTFQARDPKIESIAMMLFDEWQQGSLGNGLYIDSLANIFAVNLIRQHATTQPQLPTYTGGILPHQLRVILDYIDASLTEDIKLADLARLIDMSQFHFSRLFKQSLGISPHQYVLQQRIERAKQLLTGSDRLIIDIALTCGFSSHSHLSKQFRQVTGVTPKAYRMQQS